MTKGEELVRKSFNPSANPDVEEMKAKHAELIDLVERYKDREPRLASLAITALETAAMWAVKLVTTEPKEPRETPDKPYPDPSMKREHTNLPM